jgi:hypothetical protein
MIKFMPVFLASGFSWDRLYQESMPVHTSWCSPIMWNIGWQGESQDYAWSSNWKWSCSVHTSWFISSQSIRLEQAVSEEYASSFQLMQFQHVEYVLTSCIPILSVFKQVTVTWFNACHLIHFQPVDAGDAVVIFLIRRLCKFIPVDSDVEYVWTIYVPRSCLRKQVKSNWSELYASSFQLIQLQLVEYGLTVFIPRQRVLKQVTANWFSSCHLIRLGQVYHASMQVDSSWFISRMWNMFWLVVS